MDAAPTQDSSTTSSASDTSSAGAAPAGTDAGAAAAGAQDQAAGVDPRRGPDGKFRSANGEQGAPGGETAEQRRIRLKVYDQEAEYPEEQVRQWAQIGAAGTKLFTDIDKRKKELEAREQRWREDPDSYANYLREQGKDPAEVARKWLVHKYEEAQLTDEQKRHRELDAREAKLRETEERAKQDAYEKEIATHTEKLVAVLNENIPKSLDAVGLPNSARTAELIKSYLKRVDAAGLEITPEVVRYAAEEAKQELRGDLGALTKDLAKGVIGLKGKDLLAKGKELIDFVGEDFAKAIRLYDLERYRAKRPGAESQAQVKEPPKPPKQEFISEGEAMRILRGG